MSEPQMVEIVCDACKGEPCAWCGGTGKRKVRLGVPPPLEGITDEEWAALHEAIAERDTLDAAWAEASAVLPANGWYVVAIEHDAEPEYRAVEQSGQPHTYGPWEQTPAAALRGLAAKLREQAR